MTDRSESARRDGHGGGGEHELAERFAAPLRAPERLPRDFEERVMRAARLEAAALYPPRGRAGSWWLRRRMMSVSPLIGLAAAAGFAGIVALGTWSAASRRLTADAGRVAVAPATGPAAGAAGATDTVHIVRFVFVSREARDVALVGDFNGWAKGATRLEPAGRPGVWTVSVALPPGRHEYAFIVDGRQWATDPFAAPHADEFGTESSVVTIGRPGASAS